jgi:3-methylcrotonyl-CoA carboxylase alpha subunit
MRRRVELLGRQFDVTVQVDGKSRIIQVDDGAALPGSISQVGPYRYIVQLGNASCTADIASRGEEVFVRAFGRTFGLKILDPVEQAAAEGGGRGDTARAPMPGMVIEVRVKPGDRVARGQALMTIESMKILTVIKAPREGVVAGVHVEAGQSFDRNAALITIREQ